MENNNNQYTATVYGFIKEQNYIEAVKILQVRERQQPFPPCFFSSLVPWPV